MNLKRTVERTQVDYLSTLLPNGRTVHLIVPKDMDSKDFRFLEDWLALVKEATLYEPDSNE